MKVKNLTRKTLLADNAILAKNIFSRLKGLLGTKYLASGEALIIKPCSSVHTFFMRYSIDVIFIDKNDKVVSAMQNLRPSKISPVYFQAAFCIELPSGTIEKTSTNIGDTILLE